MSMRKQVDYTARLRVTEKLLQNIHLNRVLEIGAGDYSFDYLKPPKGLWTKIDFAPPCDVICELNSDRLILPFQNSSFELIICTEVFEHLLWPQILLQEMRRVMISGGHLLVSVPNITSLTYRLAWLLGRLPSCAASGNLPIELSSTAYRKDDGDLTGGHVIDFNLKRLRQVLEYAGFEVRQIRGSGIIWHRQILPPWIVPSSFSSNIIALTRKC